MALALAGLEGATDPRLLVGINTADDAGVFLLEPGLALVQTVDIMTPMVEDPYIFGRIAATNSLSDVYAMGGEPVTVLNIVGFPAAMDKALLREMLRGGQDAVKEAGALVVGGHTFNDKEIKYGLAVTGRVNPDRIVTNARARVGDVLLLTKPLGTGILGQMMMSEGVVDEEFYQAAVATMMRLNRGAKDLMLECNTNAATDVTGYGLLGHVQEVAAASGVGVRIFAERVPVLPRARELAVKFIDPGVLMNESSFAGKVVWRSEVSEGLKNLLWGSETSGGLLLSTPREFIDRLSALVCRYEVTVAVIGEFISGPVGIVEIV